MSKHKCTVLCSIMGYTRLEEQYRRTDKGLECWSRSVPVGSACPDARPGEWSHISTITNGGGLLEVEKLASIAI